MTLTFGSLFAGVGGFDEGFHRAGMRCAWQVEIDDAARSVLARHFPDTKRCVDVRRVHGAASCPLRDTHGADEQQRVGSPRTHGVHTGQRTGAGGGADGAGCTCPDCLPPVDVITFGSPCQDLSVAGKRAGLDGERSGLFFEAVRIIRELRPRYAIWENVPGALSSNGGRDFGAALDALADAGALDLAWRVLDAQWFGVAQRRRRVFLVASFGDPAGAAAVLFEPESGGRDTPPRRATGEGATRSFAFGSHAGSDGDKSHVGHAKGGPTAFGLHEEITPTLRSQRTQTVAAGLPTVAGTLGSHASTRYGKGVNTTADDGAVIAFSSKDSGADATTDLATTLRSMNYDQSHINGGGQVAIAYGLSGQLNGSAEVVNNLQVPSSSGGGHPAMVGTAMAVRRLLPVECCRLQGFPDWWLDDLGLSDSAKYRMLGNAVCVNVAHWIGARLVGVSQQGSARHSQPQAAD